MKKSKLCRFKYDRRKRRARFRCCVSIPLDLVTVLGVSIPTCRLKSIPRRFNEACCSSLQEIQCKLTAFGLLPPQWVIESPDPASSLHIVKLANPSCSATPTVGVLFTLTITSEYTWMLAIREHTVAIDEVAALAHVPSMLRSTCAIVHVLTTLDSLMICAGNPEEQFVSYVLDHKGSIKSLSGVQSMSCCMIISTFMSIILIQVNQ